MNYHYIFLSEAQHEYEISVDWYLSRSVKAAENFISAVDHALGLICSYPKRWRNEYADYYEINVRKFPFCIIYLIDDKNHLIIISSVYHHSRNPNTKYQG